MSRNRSKRKAPKRRVRRRIVEVDLKELYVCLLKENGVFVDEKTYGDTKFEFCFASPIAYYQKMVTLTPHCRDWASPKAGPAW